MNTTKVSQALALHPACLLVFLLTASNPVLSQESQTDAPTRPSQDEALQDKARLRVFGQNGVMVEFYQNSICAGGNAQKIRVSGNWGDTFASFLGSVKNTSVGIKETPNTDNLFQRGGIGSKAYFREYEVPANQPVSLRMNFGNISGVSCGMIGGTFTPEAGKDYEIGLNWRAKHCLVSVQEIQEDERGQIIMQDVATTPTPKCE